MMKRSFATPTPSKSSRQTFQPFLETLESRETPSSLQAQVSAAFHELPLAVSSLQQNIMAGNVQNGMNNFQIITNDVNTLANGANNFAPSSRFQIDLALYTSGIQLYQEGFTLFQMNDSPDANAVGNLGAHAAISGLFDFLAMQDGVSNGNLTLS